MIYCKRCIYPNTKPDLFIDAEGICSACRNFDKRQTIDYPKRMEELKAILERYRSKDGSNYDCIVPGSGGKDSTFQALKIRELGYNPLIVTATTQHLTKYGRANIENLKQLGFDYVEVTMNPVIRRKVDRLALETVGDISWSEHVGIFTIPIREAVQRNIPLLIWGENSQHEYGGPAQASDSDTLTRRWLEEFGGLLGLRVADLPDLLGIHPRELIQYQYPSDAELKRVGVTGLFLGYFMNWDGFANAEYVKQYGWKPYDKEHVEGSIGDYENLDNAYTGIHDHFKWLKYGFGRAADIACNWIRRGRAWHFQMKDFVRQRDSMYPSSYLGVSLETILSEIGMTKEEFDAVRERFSAHK